MPMSIKHLQCKVTIGPFSEAEFVHRGEQPRGDRIYSRTDIKLQGSGEWKLESSLLSIVAIIQSRTTENDQIEVVEEGK